MKPVENKKEFFHSFHPSILREYDIRGIVGETLTAQDAYAVGRGFGTIIEQSGGKKVIVGYDGRASSPDFALQVCCGLNDCGLDAIDIGMGPSPYTYFAMHHAEADAAIMITGSHNPPEYNGFKMVRSTGGVYGDQIQKIGQIVQSGAVASEMSALKQATITKQDYQEAYINRLLQDFVRAKTRPLKVVWDNGNGAAGNILRRLTDKMEGEHILLYDEVDGTFPNHHPDPTVAKNLIDLQKAVHESQADLGVAFDGDADRIGVVAHDGMIIWCDQLLAIYAKEVLSRYPQGTPIIADVKSSQLLFDEIKNLGGTPIMWKTGHSLIKAKMAEEKAPLAGELSGHIFFKDGFYGHDDGLYCAIRLLSILNQTGCTLLQLTEHMPKIYNTPEIRFQIDEERKFSVIEDIKRDLKKSDDLTVNDIDGVRIETEHGWWLLRASNTQDVLVVRAESTEKEKLWQLQQEIKAILQSYNIDIPQELTEKYA